MPDGGFMTDFEKTLLDDASLVNASITSLFDESLFSADEGSRLMREAMSYSIADAGKRIRPVLTLEFSRLFGGRDEDALVLGCALEMVHTYSLIHDDLPCMDNDDYRRGKLSNHKVFGEANALLAGDGLLTYAFETICSSHLSDSVKSRAVLVLSSAAGSRGMIAGQTLDLMNEERNAGIETVKLTDMLKTGEMITAAGLLGCIAAGAGSNEEKAASTYCRSIGLAFQIVDDILDVTGSSDELGKLTGSDAANGKSTYVSLLGLDRCREYSASLTAEAVSAISVFGEKSGFLSDLANHLLSRRK